MVEVEELLEEVFVVGEAVGGEGGGVEGGVGVFEGVSAGQFEGAVEGEEAAGEDVEGVGADAADVAAGLVTLVGIRRLFRRRPIRADL